MLQPKLPSIEVSQILTVITKLLSYKCEKVYNEIHPYNEYAHLYS